MADSKVDACTPGQQCSGDAPCFKHKIRTLTMGVPRTPTRREFRDPIDGHRVKVTKDDATRRGNLTTEHNTNDDRVDVMIRPDHVSYQLGRKS